ncbi:MAG: GFA family protein [Polyangiaceae bacterium]
MTHVITGACLCGSVRYEADDPSHQLTHCHCSMCRKHHGAPFASFVEVEPSALRWLAGEERVASYPSSAACVRRFCELCGSVAPEPIAERLRVPAGNLLGDLGSRRGVHVFVRSKPAWHVIADTSLQHDAAAPGGTEVVRAAAPTVAGATHGSCLCAAVSFTVSGKPARWMQCHCSRCRRGRSAAHGSNTFYPLAQFSWLGGRELVRSYKPPQAERFTVSFCTRCGGGAPVERENVPFVLVPAGLLDGDPGTGPEAHIHVASKAAWYTVHDSLPQFAELPPT